MLGHSQRDSQAAPNQAGCSTELVTCRPTLMEWKTAPTKVGCSIEDAGAIQVDGHALGICPLLDSVHVLQAQYRTAAPAGHSKKAGLDLNVSRSTGKGSEFCQCNVQSCHTCSAQDQCRGGAGQHHRHAQSFSQSACGCMAAVGVHSSCRKQGKGTMLRTPL